MSSFYVITFILAVILSYLLTQIAIIWSKKLAWLDQPDSERKIHHQPMPLLGGLAIWLAISLIYFLLMDKLTMGNLEARHWLGVLVGGLIIMIGGLIDDKFNLPAKYQIVFPLLAALGVVIGGVNITKITALFGPNEFWYFSKTISGVFVALWLLGMMYTTKLLDGLDGLVTGVTAIGSLIIFLFTMTTKYYQPDIGLAALILAATCLGFLILNWHPAKIFLGQGGSLYLGFMLGVLSIISGGKIAIALLIMGIPILDVAWTIVRRWRAKVNPFTFSDRRHLHFRLLDSGLGAKPTVLIYYGLAVLFGLSALFLQSQGKLAAVIILGILMLGIIVWFSWFDKKKKIN